MIQEIIQGVETAWELLWGKRYISQLQGQVVTIFGGKYAQEGQAVSQHAFQIGSLLVQKGYSVLTGGGPGVMAAANCGAYTKAKELQKNGTWTLGIGVQGVDADFVNPCAYVYKTKQFFVRKQLLIYFSDAFVVFPGGIGTADELFEILNLMKTHKIKQVPIILVDTQYWQSLFEWYDHAIDKKFILAEHKNLFTLIDLPEELFEALKSFSL